MLSIDALMATLAGRRKIFTRRRISSTPWLGSFISPPRTLKYGWRWMPFQIRNDGGFWTSGFQSAG